MIVELEPLLYSLGTLLWFVPIALWASEGKEHWEDGVSSLSLSWETGLFIRFGCPSADDRQKPKYRILHRNRLLLVADEDVDDASGHAQAKATPTLRMPPMRPCQLEWALKSPYLPW